MARRAAFVVAALVAVAAVSWTARAQDPATKVDKILDRIEANRGGSLWDDIRDLQDAGKGGLDAVRKGLTRADANARIAAASALFGAEARVEGIEALLQTVKDSKQDGAKPRAAQAAALLVESDPRITDDERTKFEKRFLEVAGAGQQEELVKVHLSRGAYALTSNMAARRTVRDVFESTSKRAVKDEAALALASMDMFSSSKSHLLEMAKQPGENGRLARTWILYDSVSRSRERLEDRRGAEGGTFAMLDEIVDKLEKFYYDPKLIDREKLTEAAARGMLSSLDPYTAYYDRKAIEQLRKEDLEGHYGGIGARIQMRRNAAGVLWLTISEPIFSGPAYRAGLRSNDIITHVDGEETANRDQDELVRKLRGKPGTFAKIKVYRRGWKEPRDFEIRREEVQLETTMSQLLPGGIGYVNYTTFGQLEAELQLKGSNLETQIDALAKQGMKALILDLRFNSGGYLRTARQIAGMFLDNNQLILTTRARGKDVEEHRADTTGRLKVAVPTIVLVNEFSASASEILAGALQHYKKAVLVGERTFGKGSVQDLKELELEALLLKDENGNPILDERGKKQYAAAARITIAKWLLPSGKTVEREKADDGGSGSKDKKDAGGIEPDVKVAVPERDLWKDSEFEKLRAAGKIEDYVAKEFTGNKELFESLAVMDFGDASKYPGFDALYASLETRGSKDDVRELVREFTRKRVQDERKKAFYLDMQVDVQLQRGILEACKASNQEAKKIKEYEYFAATK